MRIREVEQSLSLIEQILDRLPGGPIVRDHVSIGRAARARARPWSKDFAATFSVWLRLDGDGRSRAAISATRPGSSGRCSKRRSRATSSPTFPLCNKSFNCSYSGHDL